MADIRIKDLATTATTTASDDFMAVDGTTNGTRKMNAAAPAFLTSVTTPSLTSPAATNLTLGLGTGGTALTLTSSTLAATFAGNVTLNGTDKSILLNGATTAFSRALDVRTAGDTEGRLLLRGGGSLLFGDGAGTFDSAIARTSASVLTVTGGLTTTGAVTVGGALKLANAYVAGAVVGTGSITIQDSTGTTYRIPVLV